MLAWQAPSMKNSARSFSITTLYLCITPTLGIDSAADVISVPLLLQTALSVPAASKRKKQPSVGAVAAVWMTNPISVTAFACGVCV